MIDLKIREHLVYFMQCGMMRLSKYDLKFIQNIQLIITQHKPITVNQVKLFEKLVEKYKRQLNKQGITDSKIATLEWKCKIIPSEPTYTHAHITIEDGKIYLKSPFNKNFIKAFRDYQHNTFEWNKTKRRYESEYSTISLKQVVDTTHKFYPNINYCPITVDLLNSICHYSDNDIWNPTLICRNGLFYIISINENLYEAIKDIPINNSFKTLDVLSRYGIHIDSSVTNQDEKLEFASTFNITKTIDDLENIIQWIKELGCDAVYFAGTGALTTKTKSELKDRLQKEKIIPIQGHELFFDNIDPSYEYPIMFQLGSVPLNSSLLDRNIKKIVCLKNSTPIEIK